MLSKFLGIRHKRHDALKDARAASIVIVRAIEHTGIGLSGWLAPASTRRGPAPKTAADGPLKGERVALLGAARDGRLARCLAGVGARIMSGVGTTTTTLVIIDDQPFGRFVSGHAEYRRAEELGKQGASVTTVLETEMLTWMQR
ncbi:hypothetical protein ACQR50_05085 [Sphingomonas sp. Xoc002]|uniref:hypothetical protein n=1 Tax=Sphingomonas sp. Xoc002 TaxID=2837624 RepID=UPI003D172512